MGGEAIRSPRGPRLVDKATRQEVDPQSLAEAPGPAAGRIDRPPARVGLCRRSGEAATEANGRAAEQFKAATGGPAAVAGELRQSPGDHGGRSPAAVGWNVVWEKYLARYLHAAARGVVLPGTPPRLRRHAVVGEPHPPADLGRNDAATIEGLKRRAGEIRGEIVAGKISFAEAARKYSEGPSRADGGRLGRSAGTGRWTRPFPAPLSSWTPARSARRCGRCTAFISSAATSSARRQAAGRRAQGGRPGPGPRAARKALRPSAPALR